MPKFTYKIETQDSVKRVPSAYEAASVMNELVGQQVFTASMVNDYFVRNPTNGRIKQYQSQFRISREPRVSVTSYDSYRPAPTSSQPHEDPETATMDTSDDENPAQGLIDEITAIVAANEQKPSKRHPKTPPLSPPPPPSPPHSPLLSPPPPEAIEEEEDLDMEESRVSEFEESTSEPPEEHPSPRQPSSKRRFSRFAEERSPSAEFYSPPPKRVPKRIPYKIMTRNRRLQLLYGDDDDD